MRLLYQVSNAISDTLGKEWKLYTYIKLYVCIVKFT